MSDYTFDLVHSSTMAKIGELTQAKNKSLTPVLNKAGSFSTSLPLTDEIAMEVSEATTGIAIKLSGSPVWSGPVWSVTENTPDSLQIGCVGWLQTLEKRVSKYSWGNPLQYSSIDAGSIAIDLLSRSNADSATTVPDYIQPGTVQPTQSRTKSIAPFTNILNEITELSNLESGYDMEVHPGARTLDIYTRIGEIKREVFFEYGSQASNVSRSCDVSRLCNRIIVYSSIGWAIAEDTDSQNTYGLFEEAISLSDVKDITILQAYANAEIAVRSVPLRFSSFEPRQFSLANSDDLRIFQDFNIGDTVYVKINRGRLSAPNRQAVRIFGCTINWDDNSGQEKITSIQTTAA